MLKRLFLNKNYRRILGVAICFMVCFGGASFSASIKMINPVKQHNTVKLATSPRWEIFYGLDARFLEEDISNPAIKNKKEIKGTFSNSAIQYANSYALLRYWKNLDYFDMLIYEYDYMFPVKNYSVNDYGRYECTIRFNNTDYNFTAKLIDNELIFDIDGQNYIKFFMNSGVTFKIYIEESVSYIQPSSYLFEINSMGFQPLYSQLNSVQ
ncbi:MAG: hypothetical protein J6O09_04035 [Lachnospiraceae bacterium]|nr:hypothetical protein [Lachnospiraceae bacterium]